MRTSQLRVQPEESFKGTVQPDYLFSKSLTLMQLFKPHGSRYSLEFPISASTLFYAYKSECICIVNY